MIYYLIVCRSLTYAQRTAAVLERAGITARILRAPKSIAGEGCSRQTISSDKEECSYAVKVSERRLAQSLVLLKRADLPPKGVFITEADGSYREVWL